MANDVEKEAAARASLQFVEDGMVVGLGTGSTAAHFIKLLSEQVRNGLRIRGIPTSARSRDLARSLGIPLTTLDECQEIAVTVDGADEVDPELRLIKGGGGALLHEKIVASAMIGLEAEILVFKFAQALVAKRIAALGAEVQLRKGDQNQPYLTDENNHILDCTFDEIVDPDSLARRLSEMPGVVEHGLFIGMASVVLIAKGSEISELQRDGCRRPLLGSPKLA